MKFKSGLANSAGTDLGRALAFSLALHGVLLWQMQPAALLPQSLEASQVNYLKASLSLRAAAESQAAVATSSAASVVKPGAILPSRAAKAMSQIPPGQMLATAALPSGSSNRTPGELGGVVSLPAVLSIDIDPLPAGTGADANGLRQYRLGLAAAARRFKRYPPQAQEKGWSGTAEVGVAIAANGVPQSPQLLRSSGHQLLDAAALDMIGNASLQTAVPASLRGQSFSVPLPVVFSLDDG